ncbi:Hsp20/alpha crystallin family protein [Hymenobacter sp. BT770]|uniref:Hsp20/alpha crystallin family protein n=1 Tax=Hymenobacter sp. BT770 TaxID=2886942 RepID=UPI001D111A5C|nr:Hsp20/alpha crystallin family protein [Hymenobacter sp. BT770]MCC3154210.1 Hsp20/alpha crystallin family protein [Hymenobacter sp. BT770]MDO3414343.1 Hsp20/alpha crystallin family protein [Hymenobacter sp. BT770]
MAIQKYQDSFGDIMPQSFSTMLDRFFQDSVAGRGRVNAFSPQVDAYETDKGYQIDVALPGLKRDDVKVDFQQGRLTISGERQFKNEQNDRRYHIVESSYGSFQRSFQLPDTIEPRQIQASFEDGVLHVTVPKDEEKTMRHQIQIQGAQAGGQPSGQLSERMGQQATDVQVQQGNDQGNGQKGGNQGGQRQKESASR